MNRIDLLQGAMDSMQGGAPGPLSKAFEYRAYLDDSSLDFDPKLWLHETLTTCSPNDPVLRILGLSIRRWDACEAGSWLEGSEHHTAERRALIYQRLQLDEGIRTILDRDIPIFSESQRPLVIAEEHIEWYDTRNPLLKAGFYWKAYSNYLKAKKNWNASTISQLDESTDEVIRRLSDPTRREARQSKGLVVGYVQSGKTAHFSGVLAKAADSGYRLIIVLAGTLDLLRDQTQRRIDKELVGMELLGDEYSGDPDAGEFLRHGGKPSGLGAFDWERLTGREDDYRSVGRLIKALEFKTDKGGAFNTAENLHDKPLRLIVVKKIPKRLKAITNDLEKLEHKLNDVPTLIVDDESDLASINTLNPTMPAGSPIQRTATNLQITDLLRILPRAQYLGYTATPFANVFVDPTDAEDLFPKDFVVSLPRPEGYMGVSDFYDFDSEREGFQSNERAFIRDVRGDDCGGETIDGRTNPNHLQKAIDSYILAGAIKLFREKSGHRFKHHTMLVHHSVKTGTHKDIHDLVLEQFNGGGYRGGPGVERLRELFENDFKPVSQAQEPDLPFPGSFRELGEHIMECLGRIEAKMPVRVVNGDKKFKDHLPDFNVENIWSILVGGTKLSRGYTVEGLTVSYFRRVSTTTDTLMQMGRWFGYRPGHRDLVRLFIGRDETFPGKQKLDLYEAFSAICMDEEKFREDIQKYRKHGLTPRQVPPLVPSHLTRLLPTAKNKMFNARIDFRNLGGNWSEPTGAPRTPAHARLNEKSAIKLIQSSNPGIETWTFKGTRIDSKQKIINVNFRCVCSVVTNEAIIEFLKSYSWGEGQGSDVGAEVDFLVGEKEKNPEIADWLVMLPDLQSSSHGMWPEEGAAGFPSVAIQERSRVGDRFGAYSVPDHRAVAGYISGVSDNFNPSPGDSSIGLKNPHRGVMIIYPVKAKNNPSEGHTSIGFALVFPKNGIPTQVSWSVRSQSNSITVPIDATP